jgi:RHS repeat-associated protein
MARIAVEKRTIKGLSNQTKSITYTYNLDSSLSKLTYPGTSKNITFTPGGAGRPTAAKDTGGNINYVTGATYAPFGGLVGMTNGVINVADTYNDRLQPLQMYVTTNTITSATLTQLQSLPCPTAPATVMSRSYNFAAGTNDNGNVQSFTNCLDSTRTQTFTYDSLNRIATAQSSGSGSTSWGEQFTIDSWSNLTSINPVSGKTNHEPLNCGPASTKNQLTTCYSYDSAGNLMQNGSVNYAYDAENRLVWSTNGYEYIYDGDGSRVAKCTSATQNNTCQTGSTGTLYWRYSGGDTIAENSLSGTNLEEYVFLGGKRVARRDVSTNAVHYYFSDHLGSHSMVENATGTACEQDIDYYPYGGAEHDNCPNVAQNYKFNGKERDGESGLDNFAARYFASNMGRFMTPDWAARPTSVPYAVFGDPQSLNLYTYVRNDPVTLADLDGHATGITDFGGRIVPQGCGDDNCPDPFPIPHGQCIRDCIWTGAGNPQAQNNADAQKPPQPAQPPPTDPQTGKPTPPPVPVPGCPTCGWVWHDDKQNPRGGRWDPSGWKGPNPPNGSWDPAWGHWDINGGKGEPVDHYDPKGNPITPGQAHPGDAPKTMMDRMISITPGPIVRAGKWAIITYIILDIGSRLYPPRDLVPIP